MGRSLRETVRLMLIKGPAEYHEADQDDPSNEALRLAPVRNENALPSLPLPQKVMLFCPFPAQVGDLKWWLSKYFVDHVDIFHMYAEMGIDELTEMQLKFQDSRNALVFITTPKVGGTGVHVTAANHGVITQKFSVLNKPWQPLAQGVHLGQKRGPHKWLLNRDRGAYDNWICNLPQSLEWPDWEFRTPQRVDGTLRHWWCTGFWSSGRTIPSHWQTIKTHCSLMNYHLRLLW